MPLKPEHNLLCAPETHGKPADAKLTERKTMKCAPREVASEQKEEDELGSSSKKRVTNVINTHTCSPENGYCRNELTSLVKLNRMLLLLHICIYSFIYFACALKLEQSAK